MLTIAPTPISVFFSYSHEDEKYRVQLEKRLSILRRNGVINDWHDRKILPGHEWKGEIDKNLKSARIIILLISPDFLSSNYCYDLEASLAMEMHEAGNARVVPIILRATNGLELTKFGHLQALPTERKPLASWDDEDLAWADVVSGIRRVIDDLMTPESESAIQSTSAISEAFPFAGRARVIYTCRSRFESPSFVCPDIKVPASLAKSKTLLGHVPVDEAETVGLCMFWYGANILEREDSKSDAIFCSLAASGSLLSEEHGVCWVPASKGEVDERLLDNLIVIGENKFSTLLYHKLCHLLPWRHIVLGVTNVCPGGKPIRRRDFQKISYLVEMSFRANAYSKIPHDLHSQLSFNKEFWGLITFAPNPFNSSKWVLYLIGASRPGQYLLLAWLKTQEAQQVFFEIAKYRREHFFFPNMIQIVLRGKSTNVTPPQPGEITRDWSTELLNNVYEPKKSRPFFSNVPVKYVRTDWNGAMADVSLLAKIPYEDGIMANIERTIPESLRPLVLAERENNGIGFHVTLYEFLHSSGFGDHGFIDALLKGDFQFIQNLRKEFMRMPPIFYLARQARITQGSLQVYVDAYFRCDDYLKILNERPPHDRYINPLDILEDACMRAVRDGISSDHIGKLNVNAIPFPLHITLARFAPGTTDRQRSDAEQWTTSYGRHIWGKLDNCSIFLAKAKIFPFGNVHGEEIK